MTDRELSPNIRECNEITGVIFAQQYAVFPVIQNIDADEVAKTLGHSLGDKLESVRTFGDVLAHTVGWLASEEFIRSFSAHPRERVLLTAKALAAVNAISEKLGRPLGSQLTDAARFRASRR